MGTGKGRGYSVNVPLFPYTGDDTYLWAFHETVMPLVKAFKPDVLVTQLGIDTHYKDPITHLRLTSNAFGRAVQEFANLGIPWLALGGGGYDLAAVARCWTIAYGVMAGREWPQHIPSEYAAKYNFHQLRDEEVPAAGAEIKGQIDRHAKSTVREIKRLIFPFHGLS
jgi:acetoin utilization protein AcuC